MLVIHRRIAPQALWAAELLLNFEARSKSRLRCFSADGEDVGLFLERGQPPLHDGEFLQAEDGRVVRVCARPEQLLHVTCNSAFELTRAAYHLGNRHVALQVGDGWLRLLDDYVLKAMLDQLGATTETLEAPSNRNTVPMAAVIIIQGMATRVSTIRPSCINSASVYEPSLGAAASGQSAIADWRLQLFPGPGDGRGKWSR